MRRDVHTRAHPARAWLPSALDGFDEIRRVLEPGGPALFLDFDGTLAPIVAHADQARLHPGMHEVLQELAGRWPVAVISGRDVRDVRARVGVDTAVYVGDHGMVLMTPGQGRERQRLAPSLSTSHLESLDTVAVELESGLRAIAGAWVEKKTCTLAVHTRQVDERERSRVESIVDRAMQDVQGLRKEYGKRVVEVRPDVDWDKGDAVMDLLRRWRRERPGRVPVVIGDDMTDQSAFQAIGPDGVAIWVGEDGTGTGARYRLGGPPQVLEFLERLGAAFR